MHIFDYRFLRDSPVNPDIFRRVVNIERIRPVSEFDRDDRLFSALERTAFLGSVMDSNDIEGIRTEGDRAVSLIPGNISPRGDDERSSRVTVTPSGTSMRNIATSGSTGNPS